MVTVGGYRRVLWIFNLAVAMTTNLSPRDLASVIGVSESSLKRWVDDGRLVAQRTSGGHRRIAMHDAVRFLRRSPVDLSQPEMLGLGDLTSQAVATVVSGAADVALLQAIRRGDAAAVRGIVLAEFLLSRSLGPVCDGPIAYAMNRLSEELRASGDGKAVGLRADQIVCEAVGLVRGLIGPSRAEVLRAVVISIGAEGAVPGQLAAAVLCETGYRVSEMTEAHARTAGANLGAEAPPELVCVVIGSQIATEELAGFELQNLAARGVRVTICGRDAAAAASGYQSSKVVSVDSMCELQAIARASIAERDAAVKRPDPGVRGRAVRAG